MGAHPTRFARSLQIRESAGFVAAIREHRDRDDPAIREELVDPHREAALRAHPFAVLGHRARVRRSALLTLIRDYVHLAGPSPHPSWIPDATGG
jgi:hypothetical protein